ncbi:MAG: hypothetical protein QM753_01790 [Thermomicrobiales bacterium]
MLYDSYWSCNRSLTETALRSPARGDPGVGGIRRLLEGASQVRCLPYFPLARFVDGDQQRDGDPGEGGVQTGRIDRAPRDDCQRQIGRSQIAAQIRRDGTQPPNAGQRQDGDRQRPDVQVIRVEDRDYQQRADIIDHRQGQQEDAQVAGELWPCHRQGAEQEGGVRRDDDAPGVRRAAAPVEGEEDQRRHHQTREGRDDRDHGAGAIA